MNRQIGEETFDVYLTPTDIKQINVEFDCIKARMESIESGIIVIKKQQQGLQKILSYTTASLFLMLPCIGSLFYYILREEKQLLTTPKHNFFTRLFTSRFPPPGG